MKMAERAGLTRRSEGQYRKAKSGEVILAVFADRCAG